MDFNLMLMTWKVDKVFDTRGHILQVGAGHDAETVRRQFDRPDDLAILTGADGSDILCRASDVDLVKARVARRQRRPRKMRMGRKRA